ncbi:AMP-responsive element-binding 3 3-B isoform X2 [Octopus vulgaris]|uniref:AMP-responsive element-binding 3 3-B isoform X2 n=1 Tax=Octopus vulgaris TaxID=6645 RepID=A0AA36B5C2_OCTVU|nr:AMP-responsive element-binding 3 3-B isoform X2 [Octopus vulgaris]
MNEAPENERLLDMLFNTNDGILKDEFRTDPFDNMDWPTLDINDNLTFDTEFEDLFSEIMEIAIPAVSSNLDDSSPDSCSLSPIPLATTITSKEIEMQTNQEITEAIYSDHDYVQRSPSSSDCSISQKSCSSPVPQSVESEELSPSSYISIAAEGEEEEKEENEEELDAELANPESKDSFSQSYSNINLNDISNLGLSIELGSGGESISTNNAWVLNDNVVSTEPTQTIKVIRLPSEKTSDSLSYTIKHDSQSSLTAKNNKLPIILTDEEKTLLTREGYVLPTNMPLTKEEERALKSVRRKIRNKISAKESRKRRQEYVDGLEKRVKFCTVENQQLHKKIMNLEKQNISLVTQMKKLQSLIMSSTNKPVQTSTCLMVLLLSFALIVVPAVNPFRSKSNTSTQIVSQGRMPGNSRSLLQKMDDRCSSNDDSYPMFLQRNRFQNQLQSPAVCSLTEPLKSDISDSDIDKEYGPELYKVHDQQIFKEHDHKSYKGYFPDVFKEHGPELYKAYGPTSYKEQTPEIYNTLDQEIYKEQYEEIYENHDEETYKVLNDKYTGQDQEFYKILDEKFVKEPSQEIFKEMDNNIYKEQPMSFDEVDGLDLPEHILKPNVSIRVVASIQPGTGSISGDIKRSLQTSGATD